MNNATAIGMEALARTTAVNAETLIALIPVAKDVARAAFPEGITMTEVRAEAVKRGILSGKETGHELSFLGSLGKAAGLVNTGAYRRSPLDVTHGKIQVVWKVAA